MSTTSDRSHAADERLAPSFLLLVYTNAFITGAVVMGFEMLGSRYLNPFFGSGIYTWAALISTVLAALTAGYFFGGWMADRKPKPAGLGWLIVAGSAYLALIPLFADGLMEFLSSLLGGLSDQREFERWGSIAGAMLLLFVPLALLGVYSPYAIRLTLRATSRSGTVAGRIYGISTLGSIFGTLFVTFYLIPTMGSRHITYLLSAIGVAAGLSFLVARPAGARRALPAVAAALLAATLALPGPAAADPPTRVELAQASPNAKEMAERFIAFLKKSGTEVRHGGIEEAPRGFRIKDLVVTSSDRLRMQAATLAAASLEAASFEEKPGDEMALTGAVFTDLVLTGKGGEKSTAARLAAESFNWAAGRVALRGLSVRDVAVAPRPGEQVRIATLEAAFFQIDPGKGGALERLAMRGMTSKGKEESGSVGSIDVESVQVEMPNRASIKGVAVRDITADTREGTVRIAAMELRSFELADLFLRSFDFSIKGVEASLDTAKDPAFARDMKELGYTTLKMNAEIVYRYDEPAKSFDLGKLEFDVAEMGAITLAIRLGGVTAEDIKKAMEPPPAPPPGQTRPPARDGAAMMGLLARLNLLSADLSVRDKSILGRVIKRESQKRQTDEASIRAQYRALLTGLRDEQPEALVKEAFDAVIAFLENPGELVVEVRPPAPVNVLAIGATAVSNPAQLRTLLGIKITAKKP
jgi:MFS family permease